MKLATDPIAQLMMEHDTMLMKLKLLRKAVGGVTQNGYSSKSFRHIDSALKFIEDEVGVHNLREEGALWLG